MEAKTSKREVYFKMAKIIKTRGKEVEAYVLGENSDLEDQMLKDGRIRKTEEGYELFSQESKGEKGQVAQEGDYFKVDSRGYPYPNSREWFEENHRHISEDLYEQVPKELDSWERGEPVTEEIRFLLDEGKLKLNEDEPEKYFEAFLWGTLLQSADDSLVIIYSVDRNEEGEILDIDFNFITRREFEKTYKYC